MLPPPDAIRPTWARFNTQPGFDAADSIGTLAVLKHHVNVEHTEDDDYLTGLLITARQLVGDYTRWPMITGSLRRTARWTWTETYYETYTTRYYPRLILPGPVDDAATIRTCEYHGGQLIAGDTLSSIPDRFPRLPHDAVLTLPDDFVWDRGDQLRPPFELIIQYGTGWGSIYSGDTPWPRLVAHTIYRVAATLYLYREATMLGDGPIRRIMESALGPATEVVL